MSGLARNRHNGILTLVAATCLLLVGCSSSGPGARKSRFTGSRTIDSVHLLAVPVALNLDATPGPDGFGVRIYLSSSRQAAGLAVKGGQLEVLMYDGVFDAQNSTNTQPLRTWQFTADTLKPYASRTSLGVGYELALRWENNRPKQSHITVLARYTTAQGHTSSSEPNSISVAVK